MPDKILRDINKSSVHFLLCALAPWREIHSCFRRQTGDGLTPNDDVLRQQVAES
jgi:hypothetical protein